ncbi:MAG: RNA 3'-terminal phosphate cyclase [bacterium]|nr:RNA 3'-terminal phosphate cyclase [bacterium]
MIVIDGSAGEGGGQILRSALTLSGCTGQPFVIRNIRGARRKPGLMRQHLTCVLAAQQITDADVLGAEVGSQMLTFQPSGKLRGGRYEFAIGTAGSTTLVLQTIWPLLAQASEASTVTITGGTHNPGAPPFEFLASSFAPVLRRLGIALEVELASIGFAPAGGGRIVASVARSDAATGRFEWLERGDVISRRATAVLANLSANIGRRELNVVRKKLCFGDAELELTEPERVVGQGNVLTIEHRFATGVHVATGFGRIGVTAERVATNAVGEVRRWLAAENAPVGEHLADQLLMPLALAAGGTFRTCEPTEHTRTNAELVERFTGRSIRIEGDGPSWLVDVS